MGMFIVMMCPVGIAVALVRRYARAVPAGPAMRGDVPERLLQWAARACVTLMITGHDVRAAWRTRTWTLR